MEMWQMKWECREYPILRLELSRMLPYNVKVDIRKEFDTDISHPESSELIHKLYEKFNKPVVVLVDEYDALANAAMYQIKDETFTEAVMEWYNQFFWDLKSATESIKLVWVTGVNKLAIDALDSGANSFVDLSYSDEFATAVGFTRSELTNYFDPYIRNFATTVGKTPQAIMEELVHWYDGYRFSLTNEKLNDVFNPISVVNCLREQIKSSSNAVAGMKQLLRYVLQHTTVFRNAVKNPSRLYLLTLSFSEGWNSRITQWVIIPYEYNAVRFDKMQASSENITQILMKKYGSEARVLKIP
ncbi:hypothetical protein U1Q18_051951 [Sarracenia purpurea var. burkii]